MKKIVILGTGGFAQEVLSFLQFSKSYKVIGFTDSNSDLKGKIINSIPVLGNDNVLKNLIEENVSHAFVAIGRNTIRELLFKKIYNLGFKHINVIHPSAVIAHNVSIGQGVVIYPNVTINTNVCIGNSVLINSNVSIGHDVEIGDFVNINPGVNIAGRVKINNSSFLGIGCSVLENIVIGSKAIVGGGAMVTRDVSPATNVVGVPAKPIVRDGK